MAGQGPTRGFICRKEKINRRAERPKYLYIYKIYIIYIILREVQPDTHKERKK